MNKARRDRLTDITERLAAIYHELDEIADEERAAFDALPEGLQQSEKGQQMEAAADEIENARSSVDDAQHSTEEACNG